MNANFHDHMQQWANGHRPTCIACLGDSVTAGYTASGVIDHAQVYHARLKNELAMRYPLAVVNIINAGVAGDSAQGGCNRLQRDALVHQPDALIIAFGLNDSAGHEAGLPAFEKSLRHVVQTSRDAGVKWLVLVTPPMMATADNPHIHANDRRHVASILQRHHSGALPMYAQTIRQVARAMDVPLADVHARWQALADAGTDTNAMLANGLNHPTGQAHAIHTDEILKALLA